MYSIIPLCSVIATYLWMQITKKHNESHSSPICFTLNKQAINRAQAIVLFICMIHFSSKLCISELLKTKSTAVSFKSDD